MHQKSVTPSSDLSVYGAKVSALVAAVGSRTMAADPNADAAIPGASPPTCPGATLVPLTAVNPNSFAHLLRASNGELNLL